MKTLASSLSLLAVLVASHAALADEKNADQVPTKPAPPHVFLSVGGGASVSSVDAGSVHYISEHAHFDVAVGHEVLAGDLGGDRLSMALAYVFGMDVNDGELLHHHGFGLVLRKSWFYVTIDGGLALLHGFQDGSFAAGGHFGVQPGFRIGPVQIGLPVSVDVFTLPVAELGATLGFQI